jgi:hypothetical protein
MSRQSAFVTLRFPMLYFNMFRENRLVDRLQLRTIVNPASVSRTVRRIVQDVLKTVPITRVTTLADQGDSNIVPNVLLQLYRKCFGMLGAALAGVELYGPNTKCRPFRLQVERGRCDPRDERISCRPTLSLSNAAEKESLLGRARLGVVIRRALSGFSATFHYPERSRGRANAKQHFRHFSSVQRTIECMKHAHDPKSQARCWAILSAA